MTTRWYKGIIALLLVLNGTLVWKILSMSDRSPSAQHGSAEYVSRATIPDVAVVDRAGRTRSLRGLVAQRPRTLLIAFSPSDCPSCLEERKLWGKIAERVPIAVYGIGISPSPAEFWAWESNIGIPVETYLDTAFAFADSMGFRVTPLKVLASSEGTVLWVDPSRLSTEALDAFWEDISRALNIQN